MKRLILAFLFLSLPTWAAVCTEGSDVTTGISGNLVTGGDCIQFDLLGSRWATVRWTVTVAGSATVTTQFTKDGTNWLQSAYSVNVSATSANPSTAPWSNNGPVVGTYEVPLPGTAVAFRILCGTTGTATNVVINAGSPYVPGMEVRATLYDVTEGSIGAGLTTGVLDVSGWATTQINFTTPTTQVWSFNAVDDAGVSLLPTITTTAASSAALLLTPTAGGATGASLAASVTSSLSWSGKRIKLNLPINGTVSTGRAVVIARR